jgi:serine/threonine-protein kinase
MTAGVEKIGRYQVLEEVGRGAMGVVYKAQDPAIGRQIAVKSIRLNEMTDPAERDRLRDRLFREAQSAGILSHPGIVTIYDIAEENGLAYIFMEFVNGPSLEKLLASDQPPDKDSLLSIFRQTAAALDYAHKKGIVHRDIKPANIMIHEDGSAKVTDFGVAKIVSQQMTQAGTMMGTPSYMSPEQIGGSGIDGRSDQWALGVIVYEVLTGEKPFVADYLPTLLFKIVKEEPPPPQRLNPTLAPQVEAVLLRALAKRADDRFATCSKFIDALSVALGNARDWIALPRGGSSHLATVSTSDKMGPGGQGEDAPTVPFPQPNLPPAAAAHGESEPAGGAPAPARPLPPRIEEQESHTVRNALLAAAALVLAAGAYIGYQKLTAPAAPAAAVETSAPKPAEPVTPAPPKPAKPKPAEQAKAEPAKPAESPKAENAKPAEPLQPGATVEFSIDTVPGGATAVIDGSPESTCRTPCNLPLASGRHTVLFKLDGYRDANRIVMIPQDKALVVDLVRMTGMLSITSDPPGLPIMINGELRAEKTPAMLRNLPVGTYKVAVIRDGKKQEFTVQIRDGEVTQRNLEFIQ